MSPALGVLLSLQMGSRPLTRIRLRQLAAGTEELYAAFSPDRSRLLTGGDGAKPTVHVWDVETGKCLHELHGHRGPVAAVAWTHDQQRVASGAFDGCVRLWDLSSGNCIRVIEGHPSYVRSVAFSRSSDELLSGAGDGACRLWNLTDGQLMRSFHGHTDGVYRAVFTPDELGILSVGRDHTIRCFRRRFVCSSAATRRLRSWSSR